MAKLTRPSKSALFDSSRMPRTLFHQPIKEGTTETDHCCTSENLLNPPAKGVNKSWPTGCHWWCGPRLTPRCSRNCCQLWKPDCRRESNAYCRGTSRICIRKSRSRGGKAAFLSQTVDNKAVAADMFSLPQDLPPVMIRPMNTIVQ